MARTLELDTLKHPSASAANITLASSGLTTMPTVNIDGGAIDATTVGAGTPSSVAATTLTSSGNATFGDAIGDATIVTGTLAVAGATTLSGATTATTIAATTLTTSGAATFGNSADDATTVTGTLTVTRAAALNDDVTIGTSNLDTITIAGTTTINAAANCNTVVGATNANQTIDIASHDLVDGGLKLGGTLVTASAAELNIMDGGTSATGTTLADADRIVVNDAGTMKQVALSDLETFMEDALDTTANITSVGTLTSLTVDNIRIDGTNIGHTSDTDAIAISSGGVVTFSAGINVSGGTITGTLATVAQPNITSVGIIGTGEWRATDVGVQYGGTGRSTLADGGVLLGAGNAAITTMTRLTDSQMIVGVASGDPVAESGSTLRTSIGCDAAGTDNSTNVSLSGTPDYITLSGQVITRGLVNLTTDITGTLPVAKGGTGATGSSTGSGGVVLSASPTFTGTVVGVTKTHVGLSNVSNTNLADIRSGTTASDVGLGNVSNVADGSQVSVGALTTGSIASGFGAISTTNAITTTGTITGGTVIGSGTTVGSNAAGTRTVTTGDPPSGSNGDIHYEY